MHGRQTTPVPSLRAPMAVIARQTPRSRQVLGPARRVSEITRVAVQRRRRTTVASGVSRANGARSTTDAGAARSEPTKEHERHGSRHRNPLPHLPVLSSLPRGLHAARVSVREKGDVREVTLEHRPCDARSWGGGRPTPPSVGAPPDRSAPLSASQSPPLVSTLAAYPRRRGWLNSRQDISTGLIIDPRNGHLSRI